VDDERWQPDEALLLTVRTRSLEIRELSGPDRSWIVAGLSSRGWTVAAIADRLRCSLRLVQTVKAEPMTRVAVYALDMSARLTRERDLRMSEESAARIRAAEQDRIIERLTAQRDALLAQIRMSAATGRSTTLQSRSPGRGSETA